MDENNKNIIEVDRRTLISLLDHYRDMLVTKFPTRLITNAFKETLQRELDAYQQKKAKTESFFIWKIPMRVLTNPRTCDVDVEPAVEVKIT
jgi:hypothetical protein